MATENHYQLLEIGVEATPEDIKQAFRRLARRYHPDFNPGDAQAEAHFRLICQAYEVLMDPEQRWRYDQTQTRTKETIADQFQRESAKPNYQTCYEEGSQQAAWRDYAAAIEWFNQAIELKPDFWQAYLERAQCFYIQGNDREVLEDCLQTLRLYPQHSKALYLQGRAQHRLGYVAAALESYSQAIAQEPSAAQTFYYRGVANQDLHQRSMAIADFQTAQLLYRQKQDGNGYELATAALKKLTRYRPTSLGQGWIGKSRIWLSDLVTTLSLYLLNPGGNLLSAFARLSSPRAIAVGLGLLLLEQIGVFLVGVFRGLAVWALLINLLLLSLGLILSGQLLQFFLRGWQGWAASIFVAGTTLFPTVIGFCSILLIGRNLTILIVTILLLTGWYALLTLYTGCLQLFNFSEAQAAIAVPSLVFCAGVVTYWVGRVL